MFIVEKTTEFDKWLKKLNDLKAKAKILFRIQKLEKDEHPLANGPLEMEFRKCE